MDNTSTTPHPRIARPALAIFIALSVLTGLAYPLATTGIAQLVFPRQANGSILDNKDGQPVGSALIGQSFTAPRYFWGRLSATADQPYNGLASSGSNLGPRNPDLAKAAQARIDALRQADPDNAAPIPVDLVSASGSGLDPHIGIAAARYQAPRVVRERGLTPDAVARLIDANTSRPFIGILGEPVVNVLTLNLALDALPAH